MKWVTVYEWRNGGREGYSGVLQVTLSANGSWVIQTQSQLMSPLTQRAGTESTLLGASFPLVLQPFTLPEAVSGALQLAFCRWGAGAVRRRWTVQRPVWGVCGSTAASSSVTDCSAWGPTRLPLPAWWSPQPPARYCCNAGGRGPEKNLDLSRHTQQSGIWRRH